MNLQDVFYHGIRSQIRRVLGAMTDSEIDAGLTAFVDGQKNWSHCFFARACPGLNLDESFRDALAEGIQFVGPEQKLMKHLDIPTPIPIRIVYCTFDNHGVAMSRDEMLKFINDCRMSDDGVSQEVLDVLKGVDYSGVESTPVSVACGLPSEDTIKRDLLDDEWLTGQGGY